MIDRLHVRAFSGMCLFVAAGLLAAAACGGEVVLKNGTILNGSATPIVSLPTGPQTNNNAPTVVYTMLMVSNDLAQYFVPARQVASTPEGANVQRLETFKLDPPFMNRTKAVGALGGFLEIQPFDEHGRRRVTLSTATGPLNVIQGITQITAEHVRIEGLNVFWRTGLATSSLSPQQLDAILHQAIKPKNPDERLKIVRFYIQAQQFDRAQEELDEIRGDFPELAARCKEVGLQLTQMKAQMILDELRLRQEAGQYVLAYQFAQKFPTEDVSASVLKDVREFVQDFDARREQAEQAVVLMGNLEAALTDRKLAQEVAPRRAEISEKLHPDNLDRLDAFLKLSNDPNSTPQEKLALALSGWVVGSNNATTKLPDALNLWQARVHIRDYLRSARDGANERLRALERLQKVESVGPKTVAQMLPLMPPFVETPEAVPGVAARISVTGPNDEHPVAYSVVLPPEYHPERPYPLIVALHGLNRTPDHELEFWCGTPQSPGQAQRRGYIVIAPEYIDSEARNYDYNAETHRVVIESLYDARRRFNVDSDRVYLAGHGMGGDAVFDLAFSHPDLFAGAIPMGGVSENVCKFLWENGRSLPFYVLVGELDRGSVSQNPRDVARMLSQGFDVIYAQYLGGGGESFYAEIHRLFDWMSHARRAKYERGQKIVYQTMRASDTHIHWLQFDGIPEGVLRKGRPMEVNARVTEANLLAVDSRAASHTALVSPDFVDFEKRVALELNGKRKSNDFLQPDLGVMLEDFHRRADRQRLYWAALSF